MSLTALIFITDSFISGRQANLKSNLKISLFQCYNIEVIFITHFFILSLLGCMQILIHRKVSLFKCYITAVILLILKIFPSVLFLLKLGSEKFILERCSCLKYFILITFLRSI